LYTFVLRRIFRRFFVTTSVKSVQYKPLIHYLLPLPARFRDAIHVGVGVLFLALLAQVRLELGAVPLTGQTLGVLLLAAAYGWRKGTLTMLVYLAVGASGLPIFAAGAAGLAVLRGTTAGYLFGFVAAALLVGYLAERGWDKTIWRTAMIMVLGNLVIYAFGLGWLRQFAPDWTTTLAWGLTPFVVGDVLKLVVAALLLPTAWRFLGRAR
jgi:biotin transport system substrate-specific component